MKVFTDTSGLFAALVRNDVMHADAKATLTAFLELGSELYATSYVLQETLALLQAPVSLDAAVQFERLLRPLLVVTWIDEDLHGRAFRRLELARSRSLSLVDCASFVVMEELGLADVFGYDGDFTNAGFRLIGRPGDLETPKPAG